MGELILIAGLLMAAALLASLLAGRLRVPGLLLFLAIGMAVGSDGLGWLDFDDYELARDGLGEMSVLFARQVVIGAVAGLGLGWLALHALRRANLPTPGLYPVASLTVGALAFGVADVLGGSGFLAIYLTGVTLGSASIPAKRTITAFHDGLAWVAQLAMFLTLGLLVFPSQLGAVAVEGLVLALVLALVARPLASLASTAFASFSAAERLLLGWAGLRGAVPVVLATFPVIAGVPDSLEFFNIVFFAVVVSLLAQGPTLEPLARRLRLTTSEPEMSEPIVEVATIRRLGAEVVEYPIGHGHAIVGAHVRDLGLPRDAVVNVIVRGEEAIPPRGSTRLRAGDRLHILVRRESAREVNALMDRWRTGPVGPPPRPRRPVHARAALFSVRPNDDQAIDGEPMRPVAVVGEPVVSRLRIRRDVPGALVVLRDGRYAVTGPLVIVGGREDVVRYARRRMSKIDADERAWLQNVIGALAADVPS